ncbi:MAG: hypothetical protein ACRECX_06365 [Methyloceanibacter sp.]|uniref:hypothetical protein n=1 Tax=Methyloceanibacter sp. TaxID=1965321 RepID=UPI003D6C7BC2
MSIDRVLAFIVVGLTALLIGGMGGLWLGATTEQHALVEILARADLSEDCKQQIDGAVQGVIQDYEGKPEPSQ